MPYNFYQRTSKEDSKGIYFNWGGSRIRPTTKTVVKPNRTLHIIKGFTTGGWLIYFVIIGIDGEPGSDTYGYEKWMNKA